MECTRCGKDQPPSEYRPKSRICHACHKAYGAEYRAKHREKARERARQWRLDNPERSRASARRYKQENPERVREAQRKYREKNRDALLERNRAWREENTERHRENAREWARRNPDRMRERNALRRARIAKVHCEEFDRMLVYERDNGLCQHCGHKCPPDDWHLHHKVPVVLSGPHTMANCQVLCPLCNLKKRAKLDFLCEKPNRPLLLPG